MEGNDGRDIEATLERCYIEFKAIGGLEVVIDLTATQVLRFVNPTPQRYPLQEAAQGALLTEADRQAYEVRS